MVTFDGSVSGYDSYVSASSEDPLPELFGDGMDIETVSLVDPQL
jgi:hypothetical protein